MQPVGWNYDPSFARDHFKPMTTNALDLGTSSLVWRSAYLTTSIKFTGTTGLIAANSSDGSDNAVIHHAGGGAATASRGAIFSAHGNEHANVGSAYIDTGDATNAIARIGLNGASSVVKIYNASAAQLFELNQSREIIFTGGSGAVRFDTSDGSDNRDFTIYGGGAVSTDGSRGAYIRVSGNEASGVGSISMRSGTASGASIVLDCYSSNGVVALKNQNSHIVWVDATGMHLKLTTNVIDTGTSDGSDNANVTITGGGAASSTRGAVIQLHGNESSGNAGVLQIDTGNVASTPLFLRALGSGGYITMSAGGSTEVARLNSTGMQLSLTDNQIFTGTSDGSDNASVTINAGGAYNSSGTRGAFLRLYGNENGVAGSCTLSAGNASAAYVALVAPASNGYVRIILNGSDEWAFQTTRSLVFSSTDGTIRASTNDGSDNAVLYLLGGGGYNSGGSRGAYVKLDGNEAASTGTATISAGNSTSASVNILAPGSSGSIRHICNGSDWMTINADGSVKHFNTSAPGTPTGGYVIWAEGGALKGKGSSGTVTTLGAA